MADTVLYAEGQGYTSGVTADDLLGMADGGHRDNLLPMLAAVMAEVDSVRGAGSISATGFNLASSLPATQAFTITVSTTYRVGTLVFGWSKSDPSKWFYGVVSVSAGTSLTLVISYVNGATTPTDWIIAAYVKRIRTQVPKSAGFTATADDFDKVFVCSASLTAALDPVSSLGIGWRARFINTHATADLLVDPDAADALEGGSAGAAITVKPGQAVEVEAVAAATLRVTASKGYGSLGLGWHAEWIDASCIRPRESGGPEIISTSAEATTNKNRIDGLAYDGVSIERAQVRFRLPEKYKDASAIRFGPGVKASGSSNAHVWGLRAVAVSHDDPTDAAFGTGVTVTLTNTAAGDLLCNQVSADITIAGSPVAGDFCWAELYRDPTAGADTSAVDELLLGFWLYWQPNKSTDL